MLIGLMLMYLMIFVMDRIQMVVLFHLPFVKMIHNIQKNFVNVHQHLLQIMSNKNVVNKEINMNFEEKNKIFFSEIKIYNQPLSPSPSPLSYDECGKCQDSNAICVHVSNQTTCWCLAGFTRINDKTCGK